MRGCWAPCLPAGLPSEHPGFQPCRANSGGRCIERCLATPRCSTARGRETEAGGLGLAQPAVCSSYGSQTENLSWQPLLGSNHGGGPGMGEGF